MICLMLMLPNHGISALRPTTAILLAAFFTLRMVEGAAAQPRQEPAAVAENPQAPISLDRLTATRDRPLFSPSRRPPPTAEFRPVAPPTAPPRAPPPPSPPPSLTLLGTFESNEEVGATVRLGTNERPTILRFGSYIEGWRVTEISRHRLVLSLDDRTAVFTLFSTKESSAPPAVSQATKIGEQPPPLRLNEAPLPKPATDQKQSPQSGGAYNPPPAGPRQLEKAGPR